jgi:hypothetical protein
VRQFVRALDKRVSYPAKDAELAGLNGLQPKFTAEQTGVQVLRQLTAQRITRALQSPQIHRVRVAAKVVEPERTVAELRAGDRDPPRRERAPLLRRREGSCARSASRRPVGLPDADRDVQHRRHAANPWWRPPDSPWARA